MIPRQWRMGEGALASSLALRGEWPLEGWRWPSRRLANHGSEDGEAVLRGWRCAGRKMANGFATWCNRDRIAWRRRSPYVATFVATYRRTRRLVWRSIRRRLAIAMAIRGEAGDDALRGPLASRRHEDAAGGRPHQGRRRPQDRDLPREARMGPPRHAGLRRRGRRSSLANAAGAFRRNAEVLSGPTVALERTVRAQFWVPGHPRLVAASLCPARPRAFSFPSRRPLHRAQRRRLPRPYFRPAQSPKRGFPDDTA
jgi:hypothetical protein